MTMTSRERIILNALKAIHLELVLKQAEGHLELTHLRALAELAIQEAEAKK